LPEALYDVLNRDRWCDSLAFRNFRRVRKRSRSDVQCPWIGNGEWATGQKSHARTNFIGFQPAEVIRCRSDLCQPARSFFQLVAESGKIQKVH
jgi:hypothetical protein